MGGSGGSSSRAAQAVRWGVPGVVPRAGAAPGASGAGADMRTGRDGGPATGRSTGTGPGLADRARLMQIMSSPWVAQSCYAITKIGIPDLLADGPRAAADLAADSGAHPHALRRLLRALASAGLFDEPVPGVFGLTPLAQLLTSGAARSIRSSAIMFGEEVFRSFAEIEYTLRTGNPAFEKVYGQPFYDYLAGHPAAAETFTAAMGRAPVPQALAACDLTGVRLLVDIGGGNGGLLARVLRAHPDARGVLLDLPEAVRQARDSLTAAGVADRVDFVEGSFFDGVPAGADVYVLARVLHNWDDANAVALLRRVREAMAPDSRLLVLEHLLGPAPEAAAAPDAGPADARADGQEHGRAGPLATDAADDAGGVGMPSRGVGGSGAGDESHGFIANSGGFLDDAGDAGGGAGDLNTGDADADAGDLGTGDAGAETGASAVGVTDGSGVASSGAAGSLAAGSLADGASGDGGVDVDGGAGGANGDPGASGDAGGEDGGASGDGSAGGGTSAGGGPAADVSAAASRTGHGAAQGQVMDLLLLLMVPGCDRSEAEYRGLLAAAGLDAVSVRPPPLRAPGAESVLEAIPARARLRPARPRPGPPPRD